MGPATRFYSRSRPTRDLRFRLVRSSWNTPASQLDPAVQRPQHFCGTWAALRFRSRRSRSVETSPKPTTAATRYQPPALAHFRRHLSRPPPVFGPGQSPSRITPRDRRTSSTLVALALGPWLL